MRLRSFSADSLTSAQEQVRRTLGDDAILVSIEETGQGVRILAALETPDPMAADGRNTARARIGPARGSRRHRSPRLGASEPHGGG